MAIDLVKLRKKANELSVKGKLDKALKVYQEIVQNDPKDIKTWVKIGDLYRKLGRDEQAIEIYTKAASNYALGGFLMQAISVNKMILEIDPEHGDTQAALAQLYSQKDGGPKSEAPSGKKGGPTGASNSVLDMLKKKGGAAPAKDEEPAAPEPEAEEPEPTLEDEVAEAAESAGDGGQGKPQFDALDLDAADDLFDQIMTQDVVADLSEDDDDKIMSRLPEIPLFSSLNQDEFLGIVEKINLRRFDVGDKIIKEGEPGEAFYIIARGKAEVKKLDPKGKEIKLAEIGEGAFFGEFAFFSESVRHASVTVSEEMEALEIDRIELAQLIQQYPRIQEVMKEFYKERLIGTMLKISPFFQPLSEDDQKAILEKFEYIEARVGTVLIKQGDQGDGLFIIVSGDVAVTVKDANNKAMEVARLREGDFFGEISLITDSATTANCLAVKESVLYKLPKATFKQLIAEYPQILEVTAEYADARVKNTKKMVTGGEDLQKAGMV